jgi:hypothetical protein
MGIMRIQIKQRLHYKKGSMLALVATSMVILTALGVGILATAYGTRRQAIAIKNETTAMFAADAGYEKAIFWMCQQPDILNALKTEAATTELSFFHLWGLALFSKLYPMVTAEYSEGLLASSWFRR